MTSVDEILRFVDGVAAEFRPQRLVLFGSFAYGTPGDDSDVDMLVIMSYRGPSHRQATRIRQAVNPRFPLDLLVRSPAEIEDRIRCNDFFLREATVKGVTLYAADDARVGEQGRRRLRRRLASAAVA